MEAQFAREAQEEFSWLTSGRDRIHERLAITANVLVRRRQLHSVPRVEQLFEQAESAGRLELVLAHGGYLLIQFSSNQDGTGTFISNLVVRTTRGGKHYLRCGALVERHINEAGWTQVEGFLAPAGRDISNEFVAGDPEISDGESQFLRIKTPGGARCAATLNLVVPTTLGGTRGQPAGHSAEFPVWKAEKDLLATGIQLTVAQPRGTVLRSR
jgi:hypothetical protein